MGVGPARRLEVVLQAKKGGPEVRAWAHGMYFRPSVVVKPTNAEEVAAIVKDPARYPSPVRAAGSMHSVVAVGDPDSGTLVDMTGMDRILEIGPDFVRTEPGALYIDVARELHRHGLQFHINTEIGNATIGAVACAGTKDASLPGQFGQVSSYVRAVKLVTGDGSILEVDADQDPETMRAMRSSYGLLGIITEVTIAVKPLTSISVRHESLSIDDFERVYPSLLNRKASMFLYIYPFLDAVTVETIEERPAQGMTNPMVFWIRNFVFRTAAGANGRLLRWLLPVRPVRNFVADQVNRGLMFTMAYLLRSRRVKPSAQIVRYGKRGDIGAYTFSLWAFPSEDFIKVLREYLKFCRDHDRLNGYRGDMVTVAYLVNQDDNNVFSYSKEGRVTTIDPVTTGGRKWEAFLDAFNEFASARGGKPLFNQSPRLRPEQALKAFGPQIAEFGVLRKKLDPADRFLNARFRHLLASR